MQIQKDKIIEQINNKWFDEMKLQKKKLGFRYLADQWGVSLMTPRHVLNGCDFELKTLEKICTWLNVPLTNFVK